MRIHGQFSVNLEPAETAMKAKGGVTLSRMIINKTFFGELEAHSHGEMLSAMTTTQGSAGYVAIEQVEGKLAGKNGSFVLQHSGVMDKGAQALSLEVVPDSGTDELTGLRGKMSIEIEGGQHFYTFDVSLPDESAWI
ncbi:DUF3224 domain-containing protein [Alteromonas aestuariivivens]|uniref:DUF3224 domain-containing protein n=1 Tax=Alteromonas aestuariivivens TaxID=1938339 RepID=A0A3D8M542_9ALTE|nr:DUF3224 domain-containing protein [Alteromonas aestuariivivens]RDV24262.1 DUF3224 domain-containing protein [Alteromonas aestuariivivens]